MPINVNLSEAANIPPNIYILISISWGTMLKLEVAFCMPAFGLGRVRIWLSVMELPSSKFPFIFIWEILRETIISPFLCAWSPITPIGAWEIGVSSVKEREAKKKRNGIRNFTGECIIQQIYLKYLKYLKLWLTFIMPPHQMVGKIPSCSKNVGLITT